MAEPREAWKAGVSKEYVTVYDPKFTGLLRRVRADSTAALELPRRHPFDERDEDDKDDVPPV